MEKKHEMPSILPSPTMASDRKKLLKPYIQ
jgi:hypothetical protein